MPLSTGHILNNRYRIVNLLGQGGFGAVYKAWDLNLSRQCALKENLDTTQEAQKQFNREAVILAGLIHPNLARVTDYFFVPNQGQYLVMDYVEGNDLQEILDQKGPQPEAQVTEWIGQICDAIDHLHTQRPPIIHRDIKPANIKITPKGKAVLVDFGVAKVWDPSLRTTQGARAITPGFSPFEQYGQAPTDARTDVYALGATAYCLLTGQPPTEAIIRVANPKISEPKEFQPSISDNVNITILKALELLPDQRFQSAEEFKQSLFNKNAPIATAPVAPAVKTTSVQPPRPATIPVAATARVLPDSVVPGKSHPAIQKPANRPGPGKKILLWGGGFLGLAAIGVVAVILIINAVRKSASVEPTRETEVTRTAEIAATEITEAVRQPSATPIPYNSVFGEMTQLGNGRPVIGQYSPDGMLYVLGAGGSVQVFQAQTGIFIREIPCQKMSVTALAISADSEILVVGEQNWFYVYDLTNGTLLKEIDSNLPNVSNLSLNPTGTRMAIASGKDLYIIAISSGAQLNKLSGHTSAISSIAWNPVKEVIYTSSFDNTIKTWDPETGALVNSIDSYSDESGYINQITLNHSGTTLAVHFTYGKTYLVEPVTGLEVGILDISNGYFGQMAFSDDDTILYLAKENAIYEFEVPGGKLINSVATESVDMPTSLSLRHGTQVLAATYGSGAVVKVEMTMLNELEKLVDFDSLPIAGAFILDDNLVTIDVWGRIKKRPNGVSGKTNWEFTDLNKQIFDAVIDKASGIAALQLGDGSVELFDLAALSITNPLNLQSGFVSDVCFLQGGSQLAAIINNEVHVWDVKNNRELYSFETSDFMSYCEYYQEKNLLILAKYNGLVEVYEEGEIAATYSLPVEYINKIAVSQTRGQLFIFTGENNIRVVDLLSGENFADISTSSQAITLAFSPDESILAIGQSNGTVMLLNGDDFSDIETRQVARASIISLDFSSDGKSLLSSQQDGYWTLVPINLPAP